MKIRIWSLLLISLFIINACGDKKKSQKQEIAEDSFLRGDAESFDEKGAPLSFPIIIPSENKIAARILLATGKEPKPSIIFLHGNPGFEKNEDIGQALRRNGYNCVFFSYSGTWGNNGFFSYTQSLQDTKDVYEYLTQNATKFRIDVEQIYLLGHSMGGDIALLASEELKGIKGVITLNPWSGYDVLNKKINEQLNKYITNLEQRPCINLVSGEEFVKEVMTNEKISLRKALENKSILNIFSNDKEKSTFMNFHKDINKDKVMVLNACDHSFSDKRIRLAKTIFEWLENHKH